MRPDLLLDIQSAERPVSVVGAGGRQFTAHDTGYLQDFFNVYSSKDTHANILSLAEVEDLYPITMFPEHPLPFTYPTGILPSTEGASTI
jgi:hypothetical protein